MKKIILLLLILSIPGAYAEERHIWLKSVYNGPTPVLGLNDGDYSTNISITPNPLYIESYNGDDVDYFEFYKSSTSGSATDIPSTIEVYGSVDDLDWVYIDTLELNQVEDVDLRFKLITGTVWRYYKLELSGCATCQLSEITLINETEEEDIISKENYLTRSYYRGGISILILSILIFISIIKRGKRIL